MGQPMLAGIGGTAPKCKIEEPCIPYDINEYLYINKMHFSPARSVQAIKSRYGPWSYQDTFSTISACSTAFSLLTVTR